MDDFPYTVDITFTHQQVSDFCEATLALGSFDTSQDDTPDATMVDDHMAWCEANLPHAWDIAQPDPETFDGIAQCDDDGNLCLPVASTLYTFMFADMADAALFKTFWAGA